MLVSAEDASIKRGVEVPDNIVVKKIKSTGGDVCKNTKLTISKNVSKPTKKKTVKKKSINKKIQKSNPIIRKHGSTHHSY